MSGTILELLDSRAASAPDVVAIAAHGRAPLSFRGLSEHLHRTVDALNRAGAGRGDRIGLVLPGGPELATACLAALSAGVATPMNPDFKQAEYESALSRLKPKLVLTLAGGNHPVRAAARAAGIPVIDLRFDASGPAGLFDLALPTGAPSAARPGAAAAGDLALILQTSGTTSLPKIVPLTQANLVASAGNLIRSLELTAADRCLHFLPMFHIGGVVDVLIAPLLAGGSTFIQSGFSSSEFFRDLHAWKPTWTQAVPVMQQEILNTADAHAAQLEGNVLRFMRSVSAPLPVQLMEAFEKRFGIPVIEIFGMTETAGVITSNRLPPGKRIPGSVGASAGMEVRIVDSANRALPAGQVGEVVVQGANLMSGYENEAEENARLFSEVGFRTGDLGYLDAEGYLYLTGRVKDLINRGGEKVTPNEVDQVMLTHPGVADAACFPVPHPTLGEDVGAVVVLKPGSSLTADDLRHWLRERLAFFKIPRLLLLVDAIPRGANGKLSRPLLTQKFGQGAALAQDRSTYVAPDNPVAKTLADIWKDILKVESVGMNDDFFAIGGDSLKAAGLINTLQQKFGDTIYVSSVFDAPVLSHYEKYLRQHYPDVVGRMLGSFVAPRHVSAGRVTLSMVSQVEQAIARPLGGRRVSLPRKNPRAIFVLSTPRTGSTLFRAMLGGHPKLFSPPELYLLSYEDLAQRRSFFWFTGSQESQLEGNIRALMQVRNESAQDSQRLMETLEARACPTHEYYRMLQEWVGDRILVDKTPAYALDIEALRRAEDYFEDTFYVHLQRHPYGMIRSFEEARLDQLWFQRVFGNDIIKGELPFDKRQFAEIVWLVLHRNITEFLRGIPEERKVAMHFEDVTADPEKSMRALCAKLGLEFSEAMLQPQADRKSRMTDGIHDVSRMIGDPKFHQHKKIDAAVADQWKSAFDVDFLCDETLALMHAMGYTDTVASVHGRTEIEL